MTYFFYICMSLDYSDILFFTSVCRWIIVTYFFYICMSVDYSDILFYICMSLGYSDILFLHLYVVGL